MAGRKLSTRIFGSKSFLWNDAGMDDIPAVILATAAAIIASQALITGSFTIFSEAMSLNLWPSEN
jgi:K+ transporter